MISQRTPKLALGRKRRKPQQGISWQSSGYSLAFLLLRAQVQFLVQELRSQKPHGVASRPSSYGSFQTGNQMQKAELPFSNHQPLGSLPGHHQAKQRRPSLLTSLVRATPAAAFQKRSALLALLRTGPWCAGSTGRAIPQGGAKVQSCSRHSGNLEKEKAGSQPPGARGSWLPLRARS